MGGALVFGRFSAWVMRFKRMIGNNWEAMSLLKNRVIQTKGTERSHTYQPFNLNIEHIFALPRIVSSVVIAVPQ